MQIKEWLTQLASDGGSDLYLSTGAPPCAKFDGELRPIASTVRRVNGAELSTSTAMPRASSRSR